MASVRVIDVLKAAQFFHEQLRDYYRDRSGEAQRDDVRLLLAHLSRHEAIIEKCMDAYVRNATPLLLKSWISVAPDVGKCPNLEAIAVRPDMSAEDVLETAKQFNKCLHVLYDELLNESTSQELHDAIENLREMEVREEIRAQCAQG